MVDDMLEQPWVQKMRGLSMKVLTRVQKNDKAAYESLNMRADSA
jgi:hypothetical protein